jgi:hypothetical protein
MRLRALVVLVVAFGAPDPASAQNVQIWSKLIGQLDGPAARVQVMAVVVANEQSVTTQRGVRLDLEHLVADPGCDWKVGAWATMCRQHEAALFIAEERLAGVRDELLGRAGRPGLPAAYLADVGCHPEGRLPAIAEYRATTHAGWSHSGLIVCGYALADRSASELVDLLSRASAALRDEAPR